MVDSETRQIMLLLENLKQRNLIKEYESGDAIIKYSFANKKDHSLVGTLAVSPSFDVFYLEFEGLTNRHYASGEQLDANDIEKFIQSAIGGPVLHRQNFWGKKTLIVRDIKLDRKVSSS